MPYTRTPKGWSDEALQPNSLETNPGSNTHRHAAFCQADTALGKSIVQAKNASDADFSHADLLERLTDTTEDQLQDEVWLRETEIAIADAFFSSTTLTCLDWVRSMGDLIEARHWWFSGKDGWQRIEDAPDWLHSVDDALTLPLEDWSVLEISECVTHYHPASGWFCSIKHLKTEQVVTARARTLPLAICSTRIEASRIEKVRA